MEQQTRNDMTNLQEKLSKAFNLLSAIPVTGDHVEIMAAARELLREAHKLAGEVGNDG